MLPLYGKMFRVQDDAILQVETRLWWAAPAKEAIDQQLWTKDSCSPDEEFTSTCRYAKLLVTNLERKLGFADSEQSL